MTASLPVFEDTLADFWPIRNGEFVRSLAADLEVELFLPGDVRNRAIVIDAEPVAPSAELVPVVVEHAPAVEREQLNTTTKILLVVFTLSLAFVFYVGVL